MFSLSPPHVVIFSIRAGKDTFTMTENPSTRDWSAVRNTDRFPPLQKKLFYKKKRKNLIPQLTWWGSHSLTHHIPCFLTCRRCHALHFTFQWHCVQSTGIRRSPFASYGTNGRLQTIHLNEESRSEVKPCAPMNFKPSLNKIKKSNLLSLGPQEIVQSRWSPVYGSIYFLFWLNTQRSVWHVRRSAPPARANEILNK